MVNGLGTVRILLQVSRRDWHSPLLALLLSCATQQHERVLGGASGGEAEVLPAATRGGGRPPNTSEPPREASVSVKNLAAGRFLLEADAQIQVATAASLEHRSSEGQWAPAPVELRESCAPVGPGAQRCRMLLPGEPFVPLSWNGTPCGPCCDHQDPTSIEPGSYRLVLTACGGSGPHWEGPSFEMPSATDTVERWRATTDVRRVSLHRLGAERQAVVSAADERHIDGFPMIYDSEIVLPESLVIMLRDWLRAPDGFSDALMRRCFAGKRFGFRLERDVPHVGRERSDVAVDLGCQSIVVINQEGALHSRSFTYFDNSRNSLLALLSEAMPRAASSGRQR